MAGSFALFAGAEVVLEADAGTTRPARAAVGSEPDGSPVRYHGLLANVLARFAALPETERRALLAGLRRELVDFEQWLAALQKEGYLFVCIGEDHKEATRRFLAEALLPAMEIDVLHLETTEDGLDIIAQKMRWDRRHVPLLGADIRAVIGAVRARNPRVLLAGIEETSGQRWRRLSNVQTSLRDRSIVTNFFERFRPAVHHVVLFGALHCADRPNWFYRRVHQLAPKWFAARMLNLRVLGERQTASLEAFVHFLERIGLEYGDFVVRNPRRLPERVREWFSLLQPVLDDFRTVVVYRDAWG